MQPAGAPGRDVPSLPLPGGSLLWPARRVAREVTCSDTDDLCFQAMAQGIFCVTILCHLMIGVVCARNRFCCGGKRRRLRRRLLTATLALL